MNDIDSKQRPKGIGKVSGRQRVTMHDIARAAGCSQPTVSAVLNSNSSIKISEATKKRVFEAAKELGYRTLASPDLTRPQKNTAYLDGPIGFVIDNLATSPEGVHAFDGILQAVKATGNVVLLAETQNDPVLEPKTLQLLLDQGVCAIIYAAFSCARLSCPKY